MREFAQLYNELHTTTATSRKLDALKKFFAASEPANAAWAVYFPPGGKPRQVISTKLLRQCSTEMSSIPQWLFDECYLAVGDLAEAISLILPPSEYESNIGLSVWMESRILPLRGEQPEKIRDALFDYWRGLYRQARFLLIKLISGSFRAGVSKLLVIRALGELSGVDPQNNCAADDGVDGWPDRTQRGKLPEVDAAQSEFDQDDARTGHPYPFFLAHPLQTDPQSLREIRSWPAEWKYDGIRAQFVQRNRQSYLWSRGEELITDRFPEISSISLPDGTVIDGEILIWKNGGPGSFTDLQRRIGRKTLSSKLLDELPAVLIAFDLLEHEGCDIRGAVQLERRARLDEIVRRTGASVLLLSPLIDAPDWRTLEVMRGSARGQGVEGLMLKSINAQYGVGRTKESGVWWKWKLDPYTADAVLVYAQKGHGRRASLYRDYTFAVWSDGPDSERKLVPFAKAYSGLTDREIAQVDAIIRKTTVEKFGPVRSVTPAMVFEIGFEGITRSSRHKSGIAARFPRMLRIRHDKKIDEADTLDTLKGMIGSHD